MDNTEKESIGQITVGYGTHRERKIEIINRFSATFADNRFVSVCKLADNEGYAITVESIPSSGRNQQNSMWISETSLLAVNAAMNLYLLGAGVTGSECAESLVGSEHFNYLVQGEGLSDPFKPNNNG